MEDVFVSYVSELPLEGDSPKIFIKSQEDSYYKVKFFDKSNGNLVSEKTLKSNQFVVGERQWFTDWLIEVYKNEDIKPFYSNSYNAEDKVVFIKMDAIALGDNIAWIPYVEEFRIKHNCKVICSTFYNDIFCNFYPEILFVQPNTKIHNVYAQYYIGASNDKNLKYSPVCVNETFLQNVACKILGLDFFEVRPKFEKNFKNTKSRIDGDYICISEFASNEIKFWKENDGWQKVVDYINSLGIKVVVISKEKTDLKNIIDLSGDFSLNERMLDLFHCKLFIGVSSGLSWLAWSLNKKVLMISDGTHKEHEFQENCSRLCANKLSEVNFENYKNITKFEEVKREINKILNL
jgi:autotransporter strand-loop-strand O-heptosyltransferase